MYSLSKISKLLATSLLLGMPYLDAVAQNFDERRLTKIEHRLTVGFERRIYSLYNHSKYTPSNKIRAAEQQCNTILLRMRLARRFRIETGLSYKDIDRILSNNSRNNKVFNLNESVKYSVPVTLQYQIGSTKSRIRPYIGTGIQYSAINELSKNDATRGIDNNLRYLNIIITQGLIYDVTPNLQVSQSIHILPENGIKPIGINIGIGYRIN